MDVTSKNATYMRVIERYDGQRLDNFLFRELKGVPRSRVYRLIRRGEVRVNKKRCKPDLKINSGDEVRIPPITVNSEHRIARISNNLAEMLTESVLYESEHLLVINKPAGLSVHGGTGVRLSLIDALRQIKNGWSELELAHRLDRDTSGCLVLSKKPNILKELQEIFKLKSIEKRYLMLVHGCWPKDLIKVEAPLQKNEISSGERIVKVVANGKKSETRFELLETLTNCSLIEASPITGRTHQIRVHCQYVGYPIVGDQKYGPKACPEPLKRIKKLCLHASRIRFSEPESNRPLDIEAPIDKFFSSVLEKIKINK